MTGVTLNKSSTSIEVGKNEELEATVAPANATNQGLTWTSSNTNVATVSAYGNITALNEGNTTITVKTDDGNFTATCVVTVTPKSSGGDGESYTSSTLISDIAEANNWVTSAGNDVTCYPSFDLDDNIVISTTGSPNCGSYWSGGQWRLYQAKNGNIIITAPDGYELDSVTFTFSTYENGTLLSPNSSSVTSGAPVSISGQSATFTVSSSGTKGQIRLTAISVTYHSTSGPAAPTLTGITLDTSEVKTTFQVGEEFDYEDLEVVASYSDGSSENVVPDSVTAPDMTTTGTKTVTVTYGDKSATYEITVINATPTSIYAVANKNFFVGETISKSNLTVTTNLGAVITDYSFVDNNYQFKYSDAASGGALTEKTFDSSITYSGLTCSLTVLVQRKEYVSVNNVTDTLTRDLIGVTDSNYTSWSGKSDQSNAVYAGKSSGLNTYGGANIESIQIRSNNSDSGIISTTSGGVLTSISIEFHSSTTDGRTVNVYGKARAYSSPSDLYDSNKRGTLLGTIVKGTSTSLQITGEYTFIGIRSSSNAIYINSITITYGGSESAVNVSNYIMFEDTNNQCNVKTTIAIGYFNNLSNDEKSTFMTSNDYVISTARERFNAWLANQGKSITFSNNTYVINSNSKNHMNIINDENTINAFLITMISVISVAAVAGFVIIRKKKEK